MTGTAADPATAREAQRRWLARQAPDGDCVMHGNGVLSVMELIRLGPTAASDGPAPSVEPPDGHWTWREFVRATTWSAADWIDVDTVLASDERDGHRALAGESAAHGSIGWVALTRADERDDEDHRKLGREDEAAHALCWVAVCAWSDPFHLVTLDSDSVTAVTTSGRTWVFPRGAPQEVRIGRQQPHSGS